jgi:hypothetical protein
MFRELSDRIELRLSNINHQVGFIIFNNKKTLDITRYISNELMQMGLEGVNESYSLPRANWIAPSMGIIEKLNGEIDANKELKEKIKETFSTNDMHNYVSISSKLVS